MDIEIAQKAHEVLTRIDYLNMLYDKVSNSDCAFMTFSKDQIPIITLDCKKDGADGEVMRYILNGIRTEIRDLQKVLNDL